MSTDLNLRDKMVLQHRLEGFNKTVGDYLLDLGDLRARVEELEQAIKRRDLTAMTLRRQRRELLEALKWLTASAITANGDPESQVDQEAIDKAREVIEEVANARST